MTGITYLQTNYSEAVRTLFSDEPDFIQSLLTENTTYKTFNTVLVDIPRSRFLAFGKKNASDFVKDWITNQKNHYLQGNVQAGLSTTFLIAQLAKKYHDDAHEGESFNPSTKTVSFAFYDKNETLCAMSINYSVADSSQWIAEIIRKPTAHPDDRELLLLASSQLTTLAEKNAPLKAFTTFLRSDAAVNKIAGIIQEDGTINIEAFETLRKDLGARAVITERDKIIPKQLLDQINQLNTESKNTPLPGDRNIIQTKARFPDLERANNQSFFRRNRLSISLIIGALIVMLAITALLTGVAAPFGLIITAGFATQISVAGIGVAITSLLSGIITIFQKEKPLSLYKKTLGELIQERDNHQKHDEENAAKKLDEKVRGVFSNFRAENASSTEPASSQSSSDHYGELFYPERSDGDISPGNEDPMGNSRSL